MESAEQYDTIVIGAGIAGLYSSYLLQEKHGKRVLLLEAKDRIGGRLLSTKIKCANGTDTWDLGGQWVGKTQHRLLQTLKEFKLETYPQFATGTKVMMLKDFHDIRTYPSLIPDLGPLELLEMNSMMNRVEKMCSTIDVENITSHPKAMEWDSTTLHSYMVENCKYETTKDMFETAVRVVLGVDLAQTSLLFFLYYCKQGGGFQKLLDTQDEGAQELRVKGSMYQLCQKIAERLHNVRTGEPVLSIDQTADYIRVATKTGKNFQCENVIVAIPPHLVNYIEFTPSLPNDRIKLGEQMVPSHYIKFIATYKTAFWKDKKFSGESVMTTLPCATGPITATFDATTSKQSPAILGFICAEHAVYWTEKTMEERREAILQSLAAMLGEDALSPIEYIDKDWSKEPYNGGCPVDVMRPRAMLYYHHALTQPFGRVHWAGTETAREWCGYIEGGLESACRSVEEVMAGKSSSTTVWKLSPVFEEYENYVPEIRNKKPSLMWRVVKASVVIATLGYIGFYVVKKAEEYMQDL